MLYVAKDARVRLFERHSLYVLQVFNAPNIGEHLALPQKISAEKPCFLSDCSKGSQGSSPSVHMAGGPTLDDQMVPRSTVCKGKLQPWDNCLTEMRSGTEAGSYLRRKDLCITQM